MTSTPPEPLDEPVDTGAQDVAGQDAVSGAAVSGSPAAADSDLGYSRGDEGESAEQSGNTDGSDFLESGTLKDSPGDEGR